MTEYSEIICDYFMVQQDDVRLQDELEDNPAKFFRKMALYMKNAIPLFNRPPDIRAWLKHTEADFDDYSEETTSILNDGDVIETGKTGYTLCSAGVLEEDDLGQLKYTPIEVEYDAESGDVTLLEVVGSGVELQFDFYTDGYFEHDLTEEMKNILGMCLQYVWEKRFAGDFLYRTPKIRDKSFDTGNEANWTTKETERLRTVYGQLNSAMIAFEQALSANETIPNAFRHRMPAP